MLTKGWDTISIIKQDTINSELRNTWGSVDSSISYTIYDDEGTVNGKFSPWQIIEGGGGRLLRMELPIEQGNSGIEAAIDLAGICKKVTVIEFMDNLKADQVLQEKAQSLPNVEILTSTQTTKVTGNGEKVTALQLKNRQNGEEHTLNLDGVFVQIGLSANSQPFVGDLDMTRIGEIVIDAHCRTNISGVYAAGDVSSVPYKQIVIAMGEGAKAALSAFEDRVRGII